MNQTQELRKKIKRTPWKKRYSRIADITNHVQQLNSDFHVQQQWISFKDMAAKRKLENMEGKGAFSLSCSASKAVLDYRRSKKRYGLFFVHTLLDIFKSKRGAYHANVLVYDKEMGALYYFNPFNIQHKTLPRLACALVKHLKPKATSVTAIAGNQRKGTVTCVIHSFDFVVDIVKSFNFTGHPMYIIPLKH